MEDFVTLTCPNCGGKLEITNDIERFACAFCGQEHIVKRGGGIISLKPIANDVRGIKIGVDKTAAELAIVRLTKEINRLIQERDNIIPNFYERHIRDNNCVTLDNEVYIVIKDLIRRVDGRRISLLLSNDVLYEMMKKRILNISLTDLDYFTENAIYYTGRKSSRIIEEFSNIRNLIMDYNEKIEKTEKEINKMKEIVSS